MERILSYGTLIAATTVVLSLANPAHAGNTASGVKEFRRQLRRRMQGAFM